MNKIGIPIMFIKSESVENILNLIRVDVIFIIRLINKKIVSLRKAELAFLYFCMLNLV